MEHKCSVKVHFRDCDMYGHVNHAVYLNYLEYARIEFLKSRGVSILDLAEQGYRLFVISISIRFHNSAVFDDELEIVTQVLQMKKLSGKFKQQIFSFQKAIVEAEVQWACIGKNGKPIPLPESILMISERPPLRMP